MAWNWQRSDWPHFTWDHALLEQAERKFLLTGGVLLGSINHLNEPDRQDITIEAMSTEAVTTSEIEGEILDRASVQSSIRRQLGIGTDNRRVGAAEQGIAEMMVDLYRSTHVPLSEEMLCRWHLTLMNGRRDLPDIGRYRRSPEPMQIVSGRIDRPKVHFESPPSELVPEEMRRFVDWFNRAEPSEASHMPALTRAGTAHLYFESIHPFEDGNGRIGRAIAEKSLAQSLGHPTLILLAATILLHRKGYYRALQAANESNEISPWLTWFAGVTLEASMRTIALAEFLIDKTKLLDRLKGRLNERQEKALLRVLREGPGGFEHGLSARKYAAIADATPSTTTRDLADLTEKGAFLRTGEHKGTRYHLSIPQRNVGHIAIGARGEITET